MKPLVSVIVPVYNVEKYIEQCVSSLCKQTYENLEIILVDDGSTDNSGKLCDVYKSQDDRIIVIHQENEGLSAARNAGLEYSTGEYISFIDSDDYVSSYFYEIVLSVFQKSGAAMVLLQKGSAFWDGQERHVQLAKDKDDFTYESFNAAEVLEQMLYQKIATGAQFKICKREVWNHVRFPVGYYYEDVATTYRLFFYTKKAAVIDGKLYAYRKRMESIIRQPFSTKKLVCLKIFDQLVNDPQIVKLGLLRAAKSRVFAMTYSVFLQVPLQEKQTRKILWKKLQTVQKEIMFDRSKIIRKKNVYAAWTMLLGMNASYIIGRAFGQKESRMKESKCVKEKQNEVVIYSGGGNAGK